MLGFDEMARTWLGLAVVLGALAAFVPPNVGYGTMVVAYRAPSVCSGQPCEAVGLTASLPNAARLEVQLLGPAPGVGYVPAGAPSNFVAR